MKTVRLLIAMLLASSLMLAACTTASPTTAPTSATQAATAEPTAEPTPEPTETPLLNETGYPIVNEKITLKAFQWELDNQQIDYANLWFYQELEKKTGIHVEFQEIKGADWTTQLNLMFVSGSYADVIIRPASMDVEEYGVAQKILLPLDDLIPKYMPVYAERLKMADSNAYVIPASDGKTYYVGYLMAQNVNHQGNWFINKSWLEKVGMPVPTTIAELTEVLRAFKTKDPNGNGKADELPLGGDLQSFYNKNHDMTENLLNMFASFGVPENSYYIFLDDADKVQFTGAQQGWLDCVKWLNTLYKEGILDPEALTQGSTDFQAKMNNDVYGYVTYLRLINAALEQPTIDRWQSMLPPAAEGYKVQVPRILELPSDMGALLTVTNPYPEATLRWLDAQLEEETMMVALNGPIATGGPIEPTMKKNAEGKYEVISVPADNGLYKIVPVTTGQFFAPGNFYASIYQMAPHRVERYTYSQEYEKAGVLEAKSFWNLCRVPKFSSEDNAEKERIFTDLEKLMFDTINEFITKGVDDAKYQKFLSDAKGIGVDKYVELYQKAYDASPAKKK